MRIALYTRVSSIRQLEGHSLETQQARLRQIAEQQAAGQSVEIEEYRESALSGRLPPAQLAQEGQSKTRPELTRLLQDVEAGRVDMVLFYSIDRLARKVAVFFNVEERLKTLKVPYRFMDADVDPQSEGGQLVVGIMALMADMYLQQHRRRVADGWQKRREEGYPPGGQPPYGFQWPPPGAMAAGRRRTYVQHPEQAQWAVWMKDRYQAGWTTTRIAEELNRLGVPRQNGTVTWDSSTVRKLLLNPLYAGLIPQRDGSSLQGAHWEQRLWEPEEREMMAQRLKRNRKLGARRSRTDFLLAGILSCGHCGRRLSAMVAQHSRKRLYQCRTNDQHPGRPCPRVGRLAEPVEQAVVRAIRELAQSGQVQELAREATQGLLAEERRQWEAQAADLQRQLDKLQSQLDRLVDMRSTGELEAEEFLSQKQRLSKERGQVAQQLAHVQSQLETQSTRQVELEKVHSCLCEFDRVWEALDPAERKEALHTVIESAALEKAQGEDLVLRLKLAFVPERQLPLPSYLKRKATHGVESLSPRELAYLTHRQRGLSDESIALIWDCQALYTAAMGRKLLRRLGVPSVAEAIEVATPRMRAEAHALPLEGRMQRRSASRQGFGWTAKRLAVLEAVRRGTPRAEACRELGLTRRTFSEHLRQMKRAAAVQTPEQLLHWAGQRGLLPDMQGEMAKACAPS